MIDWEAHQAAGPPPGMGGYPSGEYPPGSEEWKPPGTEDSSMQHAGYEDSGPPGIIDNMQAPAATRGWIFSGGYHFLKDKQIHILISYY